MAFRDLDDGSLGGAVNWRSQLTGKAAEDVKKGSELVGQLGRCEEVPYMRACLPSTVKSEVAPPRSESERMGHGSSLR